MACARLQNELPYTDQRVARLLVDLSALESWRALKLKPSEWTRRLASLRALYKTPRPREAAGHETALTGRTQAFALQAFDAALAEAAVSFDRRPPCLSAITGPPRRWFLKLQPLARPRSSTRRGARLERA